MAIGQSRIDATRERLHAAYHVSVNRPPIEYLEIVTPFRRVVLDAETSARQGQRLYGQREALAALGGNPTRVDIVVEMTFHPQNTFVACLTTVFRNPTTPPSRRTRRAAEATDGLARFVGPVEQTYLTYPYSASGILPNLSQPLLGGRLVAVFDGPTLMAHPRSKVTILDGNQELAVVDLDVGTMR